MANNCISCGGTDGLDEINTPVSVCNGCKIQQSPYATDPGVETGCVIINPINSNGVSNMCKCNRPFNQCTCGNVSAPVPVPYYQCAPVCQEDHCKVVVNNRFAASLKISSAVNVPGCGLSMIVQVAGLTQLQIGSNFYSPQYGYFQVVNFDAASGQVTLQNNCVTGNAAVGTPIAAASQFIVTPPPISSSGGGQLPSVYPYLAVDFTAPAISACIVITLTTTQGIAVNKNVQIGSGTYRVSAVTDATHITICNDGIGATPGTAVLAKNAAGEFQYPIILIDTNPCTNTPSTTGAIIVCKNGLSQPLDGTLVGSVPVLIDATTNAVEFRSINLPTATCSSIPCCFTIVSGIANGYIVPVADSSQFIVGDILQIGSRTDRLTITSIPDSTTIVGNISPTPGVTADIAPGTSICIIGCCEQLQNEIDEIITVDLAPCNIATLYSQAAPQGLYEGSTENTTAEGVTNGQQISNPVVYYNITNNSQCRNVQIQVIVNFEFEGSLTTTNGRMDVSSARYLGLYGTSVGTIISPPSNPSLSQVVDLTDGRTTGVEVSGSIYTGMFASSMTRVFNHSLAAQGVLRLGIQASLVLGSASGGGGFSGDITTLQARFSSLQLAV